MMQMGSNRVEDARMLMLCGNEDVLVKAAKLGSQARTEDGNGILHCNSFTSVQIP